jgi:uncharacterized membrane protein YphA (DoxX/SURF4 family)
MRATVAKRGGMTLEVGMNDSVSLIARLLLAQVFLIAGATQARRGHAPTQSYMQAMGVSGGLLPLVMLLELDGGLLLLYVYGAGVPSLDARLAAGRCDARQVGSTIEESGLGRQRFIRR